MHRPSLNPRGYREAGTLDERTAPLYSETMFASERDAQIVLLVGRFKQLTFAQLVELILSPGASRTSLDRAISRLLASKHLARISRPQITPRPVGGKGGGSGPYVYQLGPRGWDYCRREGRYWPARAIDHHLLAITDAYVRIKRAEREGALEVLTYETEPDTWREIAGAKITPDMYVELSLIKRSTKIALWLEIDKGTEREKQIKDKYSRYWHAYQHADASQFPVFPVVVFLTPDKQRTYDLTRWLSAGEDEAQALFRIVEQDSFVSLLS